MIVTGVGMAIPSLRRAGMCAIARKAFAPCSVSLQQVRWQLPIASALSSMTPSRSGVVSDSEDGAQTQRRSAPAGEAMSGQPLPARTVPDEILCFSCRTYIAGDSDDRYPNAHGVHPAEFKVELMVPVPLLGLSENEEERLIQLVGPRYKEKKKMLRLVSDRFPNRIDNKRYLVHLLENILVEARNVDDED
ncbi:unnamed protein product [Ascophyllum nodosum]